MKKPTSRSIELDAAMVEYLEAVTKEYSLPDIGKAVRCLINYARENPGRQQEIFDEVRCLDC